MRLLIGFRGHILQEWWRVGSNLSVIFHTNPQYLLFVLNMKPLKPTWAVLVTGAACCPSVAVLKSCLTMINRLLNCGSASIMMFMGSRSFQFHWFNWLSIFLRKHFVENSKLAILKTKVESQTKNSFCLQLIPAMLKKTPGRKCNEI